jgi:fluoroacetyl-CoA thioesterase
MCATGEMEYIRVGLTAEQSAAVTQDLLATSLGSGGVEVYATPAMIALIESAAVAAIDPLLPEGQASVGIALEVKHLAATPPGQQVRARAEVTGVNGRRVTFRVQAWDQQELIGEGIHTRYVIDVVRFMERAYAKQDPGRAH